MYKDYNNIFINSIQLIRAYNYLQHIHSSLPKWLTLLVSTQFYPWRSKVESKTLEEKVKDGVRFICILWSSLVVESAIYCLTVNGFIPLFFQICGTAMSNVIDIRLMWLFKLSLTQIKLNIIKNSVSHIQFLKLFIFPVLSMTCAQWLLYELM